MPSLSEHTDMLCQLFLKLKGEYPLSINPMAPSGSTRQYYRIKSKTLNLIGTYNPNIAENESFFYLAAHFLKYGFNVPRLLSVDESRSYYLQTDHGDVSLFNLVQESLGVNGLTEPLINYYKSAIHQLLRFQFTAHKGLDYRKTWQGMAFDKKSIINDLNYFKYYFVKLHEPSTNETLLDRDFEHFADLIDTAPKTFFMYRDYQARNIIVQNNELYFIDFQGGRMGPLQYDLVSLLHQAKARIPAIQRMLLKQYYLDELEQYIDPEDIDFNYFYPWFIYLRLLQVLGAYGLRGLIQRKKHFLESIYFALNDLASLLKEHPLPKAMSTLNTVLSMLVDQRGLYKNSESTSEKILTIKINSFSYLYGAPPIDHSGHGGGFVFDCRALPNPGRFEKYKPLTGKDSDVVEFLSNEKQVSEFMHSVTNLISSSIDQYIKRSFTSLMLSFGCTGGQHRSVYCAEKLYGIIKQNYPQVRVIIEHTQLDKIA